MQSRRVISLLLTCAALSPVAAVAGPQAAGPDLGVARASVVNGDVATRRGDSGDWIATVVNSPLVEGDSVRTSGASRAEVQLSPGNFVRIVGASEAQFVELGEKVFRVRVIHGTVLYSELPESAADIDLETPFAAIRPQSKGRYRVHVGPDATLIEVREGTAEIALEHSTSRLTAGKSMTLRQGDSGVEFAMGRASGRDPFDRWAANRDKALRRSSAYRYVSRDIYGVETFHDHGSWRLIPTIGHCWFPRVPVTWVPYRNGHWTWIDYYGWNWVPYEPWGWATSHWGRWHHDPLYGWGWYPGSPRLRHIWRPALVSFIGAAIHAATWDRIAWAPLAPGELYRPWYGRSIYGYGWGRATGPDTILIDNSVNITKHYRYARSRSAVSYLEAAEFGAAGANTPRGMRLSQSARGVAIRGPLPVVPTRASQGRVLPASSSSVRAAAPKNWNRASVSRFRDGTARLPFDEQRTYLRASVESFQRRSSVAPAASNSTTRVGAVRSGGVRQVRPAGTSPAVRGAAVKAPASSARSPLRSVRTASTATAVAGRQPAAAPGSAPARGQPLATSSTRTIPNRPASPAAPRAARPGTPSRGVPAAVSAPRASTTAPAPATVSRPVRSATPPGRSHGAVFAPRIGSRVGLAGPLGTTARTSRPGRGTGTHSDLGARPAKQGSSISRQPSRTAPATSPSRAASPNSSASPAGNPPSARRGTARRATDGNRGRPASPSFPARTQSRIATQPSRDSGRVGAVPSQRSAPSSGRPTVGATSSSRSSRIGSRTAPATGRGSPSRVGSQSRLPSRGSSRPSAGGTGDSSPSAASRSRPGVGATHSRRSAPGYRRPTVGATSSSRRSSRAGPGHSSPRSEPSGRLGSPASGRSRAPQSRPARPSSSSSTRTSGRRPSER